MDLDLETLAKSKGRILQGQTHKHEYIWNNIISYPQNRRADRS